MNATRLEPQARRHQIVDAAEKVFAGREPSEVTFEQVAAAAGVSRALVYNYFGDRGGLLAAVYVRSTERLDEELKKALSGEVEPRDRLRAIVRGYLRFARDEVDASRLIATVEVADHPVVRHARGRRYERMAASWGGTPEARILARGIVGFLEGASRQWVEDGDCDFEGACRLVESMLWTGLARLPVHESSATRQQYQAATLR